MAPTDPWHGSAKHQSLHPTVAKSDWSDEGVLEGVRGWVQPVLGLEKGGCLIVDDTAYPKNGRHSLGVTRQYCGQWGKQDNCQVMASLSLVFWENRLPIALRLYLPKEWATDQVRRQKTGVPEDIRFATKPDITLAQI